MNKNIFWSLLVSFILPVIFCQGQNSPCPRPPGDAYIIVDSPNENIGCGNETVTLKLINGTGITNYRWFKGSTIPIEGSRGMQQTLVVTREDLTSSSGDWFYVKFIDYPESCNGAGGQRVAEVEAPSLGICKEGGVGSCNVFCGVTSGYLVATPNLGPYKWFQYINGEKTLLESTVNRLEVSENGIYEVEVTNGCTVSSSINVSFAQYPQTPVFTLDKNVIQPLGTVEVKINDLYPYHVYQINWGDGTSTTGINTKELTHTYSQQGFYNITLSSTHYLSGCTNSSTKAIRVGSLCETIIPPGTSGEFKLNKRSGEIVFVKNGCPAEIPLGCLLGPAEAKSIPDVVSASAITFSDDWDYDDAAYVKNRVNQLVNANDFERGKQGKWRLKSTYAYNTNLKEPTYNYTDGTFDLDLFYWKYERSNNPNKWLKSNTIEKYSPNGDPLQERNILGIASAAKFGYNDAVPYLTAQNAEYEAVFFESFEKKYSASSPFVLEDGFNASGGVIESMGHSGSSSFKLTGSVGFKKLQLPSFRVSNYLSKKLILKFWVRVSDADNRKIIQELIRVNSVEIASLKTVTIVAQVGEWTLCSILIDNFGPLTSQDVYSPLINYSGTGDVWLDDVRVQPGDAQMIAYVYDPNTLRLLTVLDDQNFGLFYQYNAEGKLIRKQIETEKGVKTVQETHYNIPKVSKNLN